MQTFRTPFSRAYWHQATLELKDLRMLLFAALITAIRIALKSLRIPIMENLYITIGFLPNALGSMIYGPVLGLLTGLVSDTLGALLFPIGAYFPPFALVEMTGSLLFALFLYRAPVRIWRVAASKLSVNVLCNILMTPIILSWMQGSAAALYSLPRIAKNVLLLPLETVLLVLLIDAMLPFLRRLRLVPSDPDRLKLTGKHLLLLAGLFLVAAFSVFLYARIHPILS